MFVELLALYFGGFPHFLLKLLTHMVNEVTITMEAQTFILLVSCHP